MIDSIVEFILTLIFTPLESKFDDTDRKLKRNPRKGWRIFLRILLWAAFGAIFLGLYFAIYHLLKGY